MFECVGSMSRGRVKGRVKGRVVVSLLGARARFSLHSGFELEQRIAHEVSAGRGQDEEWWGMENIPISQWACQRTRCRPP